LQYCAGSQATNWRTKPDEMDFASRGKDASSII
jgi:hypothetical protein